jgi:hypothetical protein
MSVCNISFVEQLFGNVPFRRILGDVWREFIQRHFVTLHGTLGSYLRDAMHEGSVDVVECLLDLGA